MTSKKDPAEDSIVDYIDDDEYYQIKKDKEQVDNATWAIYIFAVVALLFYVVYLMINKDSFNWLNFAMNILVIIIYFCLGAYCNYKPFTALIATVATLLILFLLESLLAQSISLRGLVIKTVLIVYISMRLYAAKRVQEYENKHPKK